MDNLLPLLLAALVAQAAGSEYISGVNLDTVQCTQVLIISDAPVYFRSSGDYPNSYPDDYESCWVVKSEVPNLEPRIEVTFSAIEALESLRCPVADFVEVRDGDNHNASLLLQFCGWGKPTTPFVSSNNSLYVYFHTDSSISYGGFEMKAYVNATSQGPATPSSGPDPPSKTFYDDLQSRGTFKTKMDQNLPLNDPFQETGLKVGIAACVLFGVIIIGVVIYCLAKCHFNRGKPKFDPLDGVIFAKRFYWGSFDKLHLVDPNTPDCETPSCMLPEPGDERRPGHLTPFPHPAPAPIFAEEEKPHPGLVFANYSAQRPLPGIGETASAVSVPEPATLELSPMTLPTEHLTARTLMTTPQATEDFYANLTEVDADAAESSVPSPAPYFPPSLGAPSLGAASRKHPKRRGPSDAQVRWTHIFGHTKEGKRKKVAAPPVYSSPYGHDTKWSVINKYKKEFFKESSSKK